MVTVTQDCAGRYCVSFMCEETLQYLPQKPNGSGIDLGVCDVVVTSEGWKSGNPRHLRRHTRQLRKTQRRLSRKRKGSVRWHRQRIRVAKAHARVSNTRQDFLHKLTTALIRQAGFIAMETLNVRGMMANRRIAKALGDVGMFELKRQLEYKAKWYGRALVQVDRWAPTSKTCSVCGAVQAAMPLKVREWTCPDCKSVHDRDINAAKNILRLATRLGEPEVMRVEGYTHRRWLMAAEGLRGNANCSRRGSLSGTSERDLAANSKSRHIPARVTAGCLKLILGRTIMPYHHR